jgi:hypothetical protein
MFLAGIVILNDKQAIEQIVDDDIHLQQQFLLLF